MARDVPDPAKRDLRTLERLVLRERGLLVFDAETQDTSYGMLILDGSPHIFDTHRKDGVHVSTVEVLTEVRTPVRIPRSTLDRFLGHAKRLGLLPIPYSECFFKGNLHVYAFHGPLVGFDLSVVGPTIPEAERILRERATALWPEVPREIVRAQADLLRGRRMPRHPEDLEALRTRGHAGDRLK